MEKTQNELEIERKIEKLLWRRVIQSLFILRRQERICKKIIEKLKEERKNAVCDRDFEDNNPNGR